MHAAHTSLFVGVDFALRSNTITRFRYVLFQTCTHAHTYLFCVQAEHEAMRADARIRSRERAMVLREQDERLQQLVDKCVSICTIRAACVECVEDSNLLFETAGYAHSSYQMVSGPISAHASFHL